MRPLTAAKQNLLDRTPNPEPALTSFWIWVDSPSAVANSPRPSDNIITFSPTPRCWPHALITNSSLMATHAIKSALFPFIASIRLTKREQLGEKAAETPTRRSFFPLARLEMSTFWTLPFGPREERVALGSFPPMGMDASLGSLAVEISWKGGGGPGGP